MGAGKAHCSLVVGGGLSTTLSLGLRSGGLESKFGQGPGHLGQEGDGLVLLVPGGISKACVFWVPSWGH